MKCIKDPAPLNTTSTHNDTTPKLTQTPDHTTPPHTAPISNSLPHHEDTTHIYIYSDYTTYLRPS